MFSSILKIFLIFADFFDLVVKRLDKKAKVNFKIYNVMNWETNNYNTHIGCPISRELKTSQAKEVGQLKNGLISRC